MKERGTIEPNFHLRVSLSIIYFLGTWPPAHGKFRTLYLLYVALSFIFILGILLAIEIANVFVYWGDMTKLLAGATLLMTNCTHASKVVVILRHQARIQTLVDTANSPAFSRYDNEYKDLLVSYAWKAIFHHVIYQSFGGIAVFCWGFTPIADLIAGRSRRLPMEGWYPYNTTVTPVFEITAGHQGVAIIIACFHNVAMDTLMTGLIAVACSQLAILERKIISINTDGNIHGVQNDDNKGRPLEGRVLSYQLLKRCAVHNNIIYQYVKRLQDGSEVLSFTNEIQDIFGTVIFFQFLSNCVIICLIAFKVSQMKVYIPAVLIGMLTYMCCMTYQIFIFCWHGNELHLHSMRLVMAAYSNNWFSNTGKFKRSLQIIMIRAHRPFVLSVGKVMELSLDTFVQVRRFLSNVLSK